MKLFITLGRGFFGSNRTADKIIRVDDLCGV